MTRSCDVHAPTKGHILVAEDDQIGQLVVKKLLEQAGYEADLVADGKAVIDALKSKHYDLVLMDCFMPRMDGFATTKFIRQADSRQLNPKIPIIALTGLSAQEDQLRCLDAGMNHYVSKPVDSRTLIAAIEQHLGSSKNTQAASPQLEMQSPQPWEDGFLNTLLESFLAEVPQVIKNLQQAARQGAAAKLQNIAHRLRGAADILEVTALSARARVLEQAAKDHDMTLANRLTTELIEELQRLNAVLTE